MGNAREVMLGARGTRYCETFCSHHDADSSTQKYQEATLEFSTTTAPTICKVLPIYKAIQEHLKDTLMDPNLADMQNVEYAKLKNGVRAGLEKMDIHLVKALKGDYPLLSAGA